MLGTSPNTMIALAGTSLNRSTNRINKLSSTLERDNHSEAYGKSTLRQDRPLMKQIHSIINTTHPILNVVSFIDKDIISKKIKIRT